MHATLPLLQSSDFPAIRRQATATLQVNLGYRCNQSCVHCHVNAGPHRSEMMDAETMALIPRVLAARGIGMLDLTGGAPELHPGFRDLVQVVRALGVKVIDRCNLTILFEPGHEGLAEFLADNEVEVVASLPCYSVDNVDRQRGKGVFDKSIAGLQRLNALGYGREGSGRVLNLVYNPQGAVLPPPQPALEADYRRELGRHFGIVFNSLYALANMPIQRFGSMLISKGQFNGYIRLLKDAHRDANLAQVMCRSLISVDWQGRLHDCDFNQQLDLPLIDPARGEARHLRDLLHADVDGAPIRVGEHCYGCTAGHGSSCGGALGA
ncbi:arsenosugar biosynthesis radical SAM (seleno)protein ArsS [Thauera sp.]|jgi:radical SAM/Cys-rich protein|uniref:arsenosugar biosynthesis radical SAM (seleno)protein ArsS n=1 Tax=Thauera sp. TaxID=1905334 RepID=UPI002616B4B1|nr:arsenosugar biosynthesis radical SAM (seleno)protein ArsS [Thauera sp.]MCK6409852.1 arsenosugar biosynthesis radical SAM protein ArsS [Thauera sp.]